MYILFGTFLSSSFLTMKQGLILPRAGQQPCPKNFIITAISHPKWTQFNLNHEEGVRFSQRGNPKLREIIAPYPKFITDMERGKEELRGHALCS